jgi:hypothetical protein
MLFRRGGCDTAAADKLGVLQDAIDTRGARLGAIVISEVRGSIRKFFEKRGFRAWLLEKGFNSKLMCGEGGTPQGKSTQGKGGEGKHRRQRAATLQGGVLLAWRSDVSWRQ